MGLLSGSHILAMARVTCYIRLKEWSLCKCIQLSRVWLHTMSEYILCKEQILHISEITFIAVIFDMFSPVCLYYLLKCSIIAMPIIILCYIQNIIFNPRHTEKILEYFIYLLLKHASHWCCSDWQSSISVPTNLTSICD